MKLLANENVPAASVALLRGAGHDVQRVADAAPGAPDTAVLDLAHRERRIIVTFDRDYGELIFKRHSPQPAGVLYLRFDPAYPEEAAALLAPVLASVPLEGRFTVVERDRLRQRPMPHE